MATPYNLNESSAFDVNVASLDIASEVLGATVGSPNAGDLNTPHVNLANRTKYLKDKLEELSLPEFGVMGKGVLDWRAGTDIVRVTRETYDSPSGLYGTALDQKFAKTDSTGLQNYGYLILEKTFKMPYGFTKLDLTFLARSSQTLATGQGIRTIVLPWSATADSNANSPVAYNVIDGVTLSSAPTVRSIQLDLTGQAVGTKLSFLQAINLPTIDAVGSDYTIDFGQLRSDWSN